MLYGARHSGHASALAFSRRGRPGRLLERVPQARGREVARLAERSYSGDLGVRRGVESRLRRVRAACSGGRRACPQDPEPRTERSRTELLRTFDVVDQLASVSCPTLVCVGDLDPVTPVAAAQEIAAALPAGIATLEVIDGAGHFPWKDAPDRYWPLITEFVTTTAKAAPTHAARSGSQMGAEAPESP